MSLKQWVDNGWLRPHTTSEKEIRNLLRMVERRAITKDSLTFEDVTPPLKLEVVL
jgi:hypothetical protein